jgi:voltage-gated potassium channel Kch
MTPRHEDQARAKLLADCRRPAFARLARYTKPMEDGSGDTVTRASVKFVEAALARWGNVRIDAVIVTDTAKTRTVRVVVTDLEGGAEYSKELPIEKIIERVKAGPRERVIGARATAGGQVLQVAATEDDLAAREAQLTSVVVRQLGLRLLPADLVAECMEAVAQTLGEPDQPAAAAAAATGSPQAAPADVQESRSSALASALATRKARRTRKAPAAPARAQGRA